jgi:hypothetical protein
LSPATGHARDKFSFFKLSPEMRAELLDPEAWADILETFARTMRLGVALTDTRGPHVRGLSQSATGVAVRARFQIPDRPEVQFLPHARAGVHGCYRFSI